MRTKSVRRRSFECEMTPDSPGPVEPPMDMLDPLFTRERSLACDRRETLPDPTV